MGRCDRTRQARSGSRALVLAALACALLCAACGGGTPRPRLVVLFATCTLNRGTIAPYDPSVRYTPHIAAFAAQSVVFRRHSTEGGQSGTDFAALYSGTQADVHGIYHHPSKLSEDLQLIGETFAEAGYETHFWNHHPMAAAENGYGQGVAPEHVHRSRGRRAKTAAFLDEDDAAFRTLLDELAARPEKRAFVMTNFTVTHSPYQKQVTRAEIEAFLRDFPEWCSGVTTAELDTWVALYDRHRLALQWDFPATVAELGLSAHQVERLAAVLEVLYRTSLIKLDRIFGRMLAAIAARGLDDEAVIAFTSDHGELLYRENALFQWTHGLELTPEVLDIALMIRAPGLAPRDYTATTRSIDVYPTLAGLSGVPIGGERPPDGVDLARALRGDAPEPELLAFSHSTTVSAEHLASFVGFDQVLKYFPRTDPELCWVRVRKQDLVAKQVNLDGTHFGFQVFDLAHDPGERTNLYDPSSAEHQDLARRLVEYKRTLVAGFAAHVQGAGLSSEQRLDDLRELGYVGESEEQSGKKSEPAPPAPVETSVPGG